MYMCDGCFVNSSTHSRPRADAPSTHQIRCGNAGCGSLKITGGPWALGNTILGAVCVTQADDGGTIDGKVSHELLFFCLWPLVRYAMQAHAACRVLASPAIAMQLCLGTCPLQGTCRASNDPERIQCVIVIVTQGACQYSHVRVVLQIVADFVNCHADCSAADERFYAATGCASLSACDKVRSVKRQSAIFRTTYRTASL